MPLAPLPLNLLRDRTAENWLVGYDRQALLTLTEQLMQQFTAARPPGAHGSGQGTSILLAESDPLRFLAGFLAAQATTQRVFLGNPQWGAAEWQQALAIAQPHQVWGDAAHGWIQDRLLRSKNPETADPARPQGHLIMIPTGGSSGQVRFAMHRWQTLATAVAGLQHYLQLPTLNAICVLPLHHVSGLMSFMRAFLSGGQFWPLSFKALKTGQPIPKDPANWLISLVPTQLQALLDQPASAQWLAQCQAVFIGGGPSWPALLTQARALNIPLAPCYGMTETAAQVTTLKPADFLAGRLGVGQVLPHARLTLVDDQGQPVPPGTVGQIQIAADSLALGYYPAPWPQAEASAAPATPQFSTDDLGCVDLQGYLTLVGRRSDKIITGGENVFPAEVEAAIWATDLVQDVAVVGLPDAYWGQCVTAVYVPRQTSLRPQTLAQALQGQLARFKQPKGWVPVASLPRNAQGKIQRPQLLDLALGWKSGSALASGEPGPQGQQIP